MSILIRKFIVLSTALGLLSIMMPLMWLGDADSAHAQYLQVPPGGRTLASARFDRTVILWDVAGQRQLAPWPSAQAGRPWPRAVGTTPPYPPS